MISDKNVLIYIVLININLFHQNEIYNSYINTKNFSIQNAAYLIQNRDGFLSLVFENIPIFMDKYNVSNNIFIISEEKENYFSISNIITHKPKNYKIYLSTDSNNNLMVHQRNFFHNRDFSLWKIIPKVNKKKQLIYYVQNKKTKKFIELNSFIEDNKPFLSNFTDISKVNENNEFKFIELYKEVNNLNSYSSILANEPIDVLIKYIDLSDPKLNRTGIKQIPKDNDNGELKFSIRSILKNLPWIRKIFILMPNEEIKFLKNKNEISEKIIYIKDKDLLGFDSANSITFQYNLYKMKDFGLSENFILMDDDYFISQKINKNEFFYEEKGEVFPALVTSNYYEIEKIKEKIILKENLNKRKCLEPHSSCAFQVRQKSSLLFLYEIFGDDKIRYGKKLIEPSFTHNAIPVKINDIKELHDIILEKYKYGKEMLFAKERTINDLQFQTLYMAYVKNKYDRKVSKITSEFFDLSQAGKILFKREKLKLFVINISPMKYENFLYQREKKILNQLFPDKTIYEKDFSDIYLNMMKKINIGFVSFNKTEINNKTNSDLMRYNTKFLDICGKKIEETINLIINNKINIIKKIIIFKGIKKNIQQLKYEETQTEIINFFLLLILILLLYLNVYKKQNYLEDEEL